MMEIALVPKKTVPAQYPGLYLFTSPARMMRPIMNLAAKNVEYIGTFEQIYLDICVTPEEAYEGVIYYFFLLLSLIYYVILFVKIYLLLQLTSHQELSKTAFLSNLASLIPMPDYNQSPRNMYQCQVKNYSECLKMFVI